MASFLNGFKICMNSNASFVSSYIYSGLSLSRTRKGPRDLFEIERVRDKEKLVNLRKTEREKEISGYMMKISYLKALHKSRYKLEVDSKKTT